MDKFIGKRVDGRYEIHELVGMGGMAYVYRAFDIQTQTWVAIKILKEEYSENSEFLRRFRNESRAIAMLSHPNIVKVLDVSFGDRIQYIVMELINGITLKDYIYKKGILPWNESSFFIAQILKALQHAHEKGIIHRDIKPQNILLLQDGTIKVTDFGIARFVQGDTQTMTDKALGSVHYIAPEQARGDFTNDKADIYSVGVMLYEMITGQLPFEADTAVSVAIMQLQEEPTRPREINPEIPVGLEEITMHAMEKKPGMRFLSAREMLTDIEFFRRNPSTVFSYQRQQNLQETKQMDIYDQVRTAPTRAKAETYNDNFEYEEEMVRSKNHARSSMIITGVISACIVAVLAVGIYFVVSMMSQNDDPVIDEVLLPDFEGMNYYDEILLDPDYTQNFEFKVTETDDPEKEPGSVIRQSPEGGVNVKIGKEVELIVNKADSAKPLALVPDVTGQNQNDAYNEITERGFTPKIESVNDDETASGFVIKTEPAASTEIQEGTVVTIFVSKGPSEVQVPVPSLADLSLTDATNLLESAGLKVGATTYDDESELPKDTVISSSPKSDEKISEGSTVDLVLSSGKNSIKNISYKFNLPTSVNDDLNVEVYLDGVIIQNATVNPAYSGQYEAHFEGKTGISNIVVQLDDQDYIYATIDFDNQEVKITSELPFHWATPTPAPTAAPTPAPESDSTTTP